MNLTIKNIPEPVYQRLKELAKIRHRSLNGEIIHCLEQAAGLSPMDPAEVRSRAEGFRQKLDSTFNSGEGDIPKREK